MKLLFVFLLTAMAALPQLAPLSQSATPQYFIAAGAGFNQAPVPQSYGWLTYGARVSGPVYSFTTTEYTKVNSTIRTGFARLLLQRDGFTLLALGDGGISTGSNVVGGSFSFGGIIAYDLSKYLLKIPGTHIMFSARPIKTNAPEIAGGGFFTSFHFGIAKTF